MGFGSAICLDIGDGNTRKGLDVKKARQIGEVVQAVLDRLDTDMRAAAVERAAQGIAAGQLAREDAVSPPIAQPGGATASNRELNGEPTIRGESGPPMQPFMGGKGMGKKAGSGGTDTRPSEGGQKVKPSETLASGIAYQPRLRLVVPVGTGMRSVNRQHGFPYPALRRPVPMVVGGRDHAATN